MAAYEGVAFSLVLSIDVLNEHSSGVGKDSPIILVGGGAKGKVWQETISRFSGRELIIPKTEELVAYGAAAQAAGILSNVPAVEVSARWNAADGQRIASQAVDSEAIERNSRIREVSHELNKSGLFVT